MVYDCFMFYNELDLLWLRLNELDSVVDKFVLIESPLTFTRQPKPLYFQENQKRFAKFKHKIIPLVASNLEHIRFPWIFEFHQTNQMIQALKGCKPNDTILLSCPDELPKKEKIIEFSKSSGKHKKFINHQSYYFLNWIAEGKKGSEPCNSMLSYKELQKYPDMYTARFSDYDTPIEDGGWHYSYLGGVKKIQEKMTAWSHQEFNNDKFNTAENIRLMLLKRQDILHTGLKFRIAQDREMPEYLATHKSEFTSLFDTQSTFMPLSIEAPYLQLKLQARLVARNLRRTIQNTYGSD